MQNEAPGNDRVGSGWSHHWSTNSRIQLIHIQLNFNMLLRLKFEQQTYSLNGITSFPQVFPEPTYLNSI